jgi:hypothetical protein
VVVPDIGIHHDALLSSIGHCHCISSKLRLAGKPMVMMMVSRPGLMLHYGTMVVLLVVMLLVLVVLMHCLL